MSNATFDTDSVIGVDFGTSFSSASRLNPTTNTPEIITFIDNGSVQIPSIAYINDNGSIDIGVMPMQQLNRLSYYDPTTKQKIQSHTLCEVKRLMKPDGEFLGHSHIDIIAAILSKIKQQCEASSRFTKPIKGIVLTHPVEFEDWQIDMLREAIQKAGFNRYKFVKEPEAAALYAIKSGILDQKARGVLVYDFGGGTFDVAYLYKEADGTLSRKVAARGDAHCGGGDIDRLLYGDWDKFVKENYNRSLSPNKRIMDLEFLRECEQQKKMLSQLQSMPCSELLPSIDGSFVYAQRTITRQQLNNLMEPIIDKTIDKTRLIIDEVKAQKLPLDSIILIGGSSRIPLVMEKLKALVGPDVEIRSTGLVDVAVALGALYSLNVPIKDSKKTEPPTPPTASTPTKHFCINCGKEIWSNQKFCIHCGKANYSYKA